MTLDPRNVILGASDGPGLWVAQPNAAPPAADAPVDGAVWTAVGYISDEETPTVAQNLETDTVRVWRMAGPRRRVLNGNTYTLGFTLLEVNRESAGLWFDTEPVDTDNLGGFDVPLEADPSMERAALLQIRDGDTMLRFYFQSAVLTGAGELDFTKDTPTGFPVALTVLGRDGAPGVFSRVPLTVPAPPDRQGVGNLRLSIVGSAAAYVDPPNVRPALVIVFGNTAAANVVPVKYGAAALSVATTATATAAKTVVLSPIPYPATSTYPGLGVYPSDGSVASVHDTQGTLGLFHASAGDNYTGPYGDRYGGASATSLTRKTSGSVTVTDGGTSTVTATGVNPGVGLIVDPALLAALPTSGTPWTALLGVADGAMGTLDLADQDSTTPAKVLAAALVYKRTGTVAYKNKAVAVLGTFATTTLTGARVLSLGRQLAGLCAAADLCDYHNAAFEARMDDLRTLDVGGHSRWYTITGTSEDSCNNWGGWALASRTAMSAYLGDTTDLARCSTLFSGYFDRAAYSGFTRTADYDPNWSHNPAAFIPINPAGYPGKSGACVEDISRSGGTYPTTDDTGRTYSWEFLGGALFTARVLYNNGYRDAFTRGSNGLLRAGQFLQTVGGWPPSYTVNQYIPWEIENRYGTNVGTQNAAGYGRQFGFTDWLTV